MKVIGWVLLVLFALAGPTYVSSLPSRPWRRSSGHRGGSSSHDDGRAKAAGAGGHRVVGGQGSERTMNQTLDHFSGSDVRSWRQRYWINSSSFSSNTASKSGRSPTVFVCVGGEGPSMSSEVVRTGENHCGLMVSLAPTHGALVLALEHRYYGPREAFPTWDLSTKNLRYLSASQALMDLVTFRAHISEEHSLPDDTRWILFGGSYPGMLAAWGRSKFPHLFHAAVSSSSPIQAELDMFQYNDIVGQSLSRIDVGGSRKCVERIKQAFGEWSDMVSGPSSSPASMEALAKMVNICGGGGALEQPGGSLTAANAAAEVFEVQGNDPVCEEEACNIEKMCDVMTANETSSPLWQLAELNKIVRGGDCIPSSYEAELVAPLLNTTIEGGGDRVWFWQTCTEFGFYQTCNPGTMCPFIQTPTYNSLGLYLDLCKVAFGVDGSTTRQKIDETNLEFGGFGISATRIMFVNGDIDPWHALSPLRCRHPHSQCTAPRLRYPSNSSHTPHFPLVHPRYLIPPLFYPNQAKVWHARLCRQGGFTPFLDPPAKADGCAGGEASEGEDREGD